MYIIVIVRTLVKLNIPSKKSIWRNSSNTFWLALALISSFHPSSRGIILWLVALAIVWWTDLFQKLFQSFAFQPWKKKKNVPCRCGVSRYRRVSSADMAKSSYLFYRNWSFFVELILILRLGTSRGQCSSQNFDNNIVSTWKGDNDTRRILIDYGNA